MRKNPLTKVRVAVVSLSAMTLFCIMLITLLCFFLVYTILHPLTGVMFSALFPEKGAFREVAPFIDISLLLRCFGG